ncbi:hypothetical protein ACFXKJ_40380 [Kitasatospora indigofera]|uniref:hypothetical protein n=1 Tax=Kitasatospora indigofera TaxID=67307 RepID=UPI0036C5E2AA
MVGWQRLPWKRRVFRLSEQPEFDRYGWPVTVMSVFAGFAPGAPLPDRRDVPLLVLRGEWGMGKSYALEQERADLEAAGLPVRLLDLGTCGASVSRAEAKLTQAFEWPVGVGEWHVLLDGLDEGLDRLPELDQLIIEQLEALDEEARAGMRLRISCRTARWPADLERELDRLWSEGRMQVVGLAPLSREDVSIAAAAMGVADPKVFTGLVQQQGLVPLATNPMTLRQLLIGYTANGHLPTTAEEAYREACLHLCKENRRPKGSEQRRAQVTPEHLLAVAARAAAALQFGSYTGLSEDRPQPGEVNAGDLVLSRVATGDEPGHLGIPVPCSTNELSQLTESSLLVPLEGSYRWAFAHKSYQEFLAAEFLKAHDMPAPVQQELLWIGDGEARHVIPAHQAVAAWRSGTDPKVFEDLLRDDPMVLTLADLASRPDNDRARVVAALLALLERDDTARLESSTLHRLRHPDLAAQLRPHLRSGTELTLLYGAVSIARACPCPDLANDLLTIAEHPDLNPEVRVAAIAGVTDLVDAEAERLKTLAGDDSPEVVAAALRRLRPDHLTLAEFLAKVRDPNPNYIGTAYMLRREVPEQISADEIGEAVAWARGVFWYPAVQGSPALALAILARAVTLANQQQDNDELVAAVAQAMMGLALDHNLLYSNEIRAARDDLAAALDDADSVRRRLAHYLMTHQKRMHFLTLLAGIPGGSFLPQSDLVYWAENWHKLESVDPQISAAAIRFLRPENPDILARCEAARAEHPTLREATAFWDNPPAENPYEQEHRLAVEAERRQNTYSETGLREALAAVMAAGPETVYEHWADAVNHMLRTADGEQSHLTEPILTIASAAPSRPAPGSELSALVAQAAQHLVRIAPALTPGRLTPHGAFEFHNAPELSAFAFLDALPSDIDDPQKWAGWAIALASSQAFSSNAQTIQKRFLSGCTERAGEVLAGVLTEVLDAAHDETARTVSRAYAALPDGPAHSALMTWASDPNRRPEQWQTVLGELTAVGNDRALAALAKELETDPASFLPHSNERIRWMLAAMTLLHCDHLLTHWPRLRERLDDTAVLQEFLDSLGRLPAPPGSWPNAVGQLAEKDIADLYRLLISHIGVEAAADGAQHSGLVRRDDRIQDMVHSLPNILAAKNTPQAAAELRGLAERYPDLWQLRVQARATTYAAAAAHVAPVAPEELIRLADDSRLRIVRDDRQLLDIVIESLSAMEQELQGYNGTAVNLWNRDKDKFEKETKCWPCWEDDLCDAVTAFLRRDIGGHRVVVNREVEVRRTGLPGLRTDIQIEAPSSESTHQGAIRVIIECKGCWNRELPTATEYQLAAYLTEAHTAGLLLVGYFDCTRWNDKKRACPKKNHGIEDIKQKQAEQAAILGQEANVAVSSFVLDCRLPGKESDWRRPEPSTSA